MALSPIATFYLGTTTSTVGAHVYPDGQIFYSGTGALATTVRKSFAYAASTAAFSSAGFDGLGTRNAILAASPTNQTTLETAMLAATLALGTTTGLTGGVTMVVPAAVVNQPNGGAAVTITGLTLAQALKALNPLSSYLEAFQGQ